MLGTERTEAAKPRSTDNLLRRDAFYLTIEVTEARCLAQSAEAAKPRWEGRLKEPQLQLLNSLISVIFVNSLWSLWLNKTSHRTEIKKILHLASCIFHPFQ